MKHVRRQKYVNSGEHFVIFIWKYMHLTSFWVRQLENCVSAPRLVTRKQTYPLNKVLKIKPDFFRCGTYWYHLFGYCLSLRMLKFWIFRSPLLFISSCLQTDIYKLNINIEKPRYDQSTYAGRAKHFFITTNPLNILRTSKELDDARTIVQSYRLVVNLEIH